MTSSTKPEVHSILHPGPDHQCRLFQTFASNVPIRSILVHSARYEVLDGNRAL